MKLQLSIISETTQAELEPIYNDFLKILKDNKLSFEGGFKDDGIEGVVGYSESGMTRPQVVELLEDFILMQDDFSGFSYKNL